MTWAGFFLFCFAFGFFFSLVSVLSGHLHLHDFQGGHDAHAGAGHGHHVHGDHGHVAGDHQHHGADDSRAHVSPLNMGTISAFLAWFGGTGYLVSRFWHVWIVATLVLSLAAGLAGSSIVFWFLAKVLMREREELDPADYEMVGVLGRVSGTIRSEGIGEILFSQGGIRRAAPARSENHVAIPSGTEVVVTRFENGIAFVRRWDELTDGVADTH